MSRDRFRCVFVIGVRVKMTMVIHDPNPEGVLGIGRLVVSRFRECMTFCKECN